MLSNCGHDENVHTLIATLAKEAAVVDKQEE